MNNLIKYIMVFALGIGTGYFVTNKLLEKQYEILAQEEIDSVKNQFGKRYMKQTSTNSDRCDEVKKPSDENKSDKNTPHFSNPKTAYNEMCKEQLLEDMGTFSNEQGDLTDAAGCFEDEWNSTTSNKRIDPYVISDTEFTNEFIHHDKISLYYYVYDDVLCNENEEPIDDIDNTVGWDVFKVLETQNSGWVRNENLGSDFEICVVQNSFLQATYGIAPEENLSPRETYQRQQKRREHGEEE